MRQRGKRCGRECMNVREVYIRWVGSRLINKTGRAVYPGWDLWSSAVPARNGSLAFWDWDEVVLDLFSFSMPCLGHLDDPWNGLEVENTLLAPNLSWSHIIWNEFRIPSVGVFHGILCRTPFCRRMTASNLSRIFDTAILLSLCCCCPYYRSCSTVYLSFHILPC